MLCGVVGLLLGEFGEGADLEDVGRAGAFVVMKADEAGAGGGVRGNGDVPEAGEGFVLGLVAGERDGLEGDARVAAPALRVVFVEAFAENLHLDGLPCPAAGGIQAFQAGGFGVEVREAAHEEGGWEDETEQERHEPED